MNFEVYLRSSTPKKSPGRVLGAVNLKKERNRNVTNVSLEKKNKKRIPKKSTFGILCRSHPGSHPTYKKNKSKR